MTASAFAAIPITPKGATITVTIICAPHITPCSSVIGADTFMAFNSTLRVGIKLFKPCVTTSSALRPNIAIPFCRKQAYHIMKPAVTTSAPTVPNAAPSTPRPAPGINRECPKIEISRVGNIRKKLNTTSRRHIMALSPPGIFIFPDARSIAAPR